MGSRRMALFAEVHGAHSARCYRRGLLRRRVHSIHRHYLLYQNCSTPDMTMPVTSYIRMCRQDRKSREQAMCLKRAGCFLSLIRMTLINEIAPGPDLYKLHHCSTMEA